MMTAEQQMKSLKYAIAHLSDEVQSIDEMLKNPSSDFIKNVMALKKKELAQDLEELTKADKELRAAHSKRMTKEEWKAALKNLQWMKGMQGEDVEIDITWLDDTNEWVLNAWTELLEDGFTSEEEAQERLNFIEKNYI